MDKKVLSRKIKSLGKKTEAWRNEVQLCLIGCCYQAIEGDSNIDPCLQIVKVLKGADLSAVIHWLEEHAPVIWSKAKESFVFNKSFEGGYDAVRLMSEPWYEKAIKPANVSSSIDMYASLQEFIKRMEREVKSGNKTIAHKEVLDELKAVAGKIAQTEVK